MKGVKIGQIQWLCFWAMVFTKGQLFPLWMVSLLLNDKSLDDKK